MEGSSHRLPLRFSLLPRPPSSTSGAMWHDFKDVPDIVSAVHGGHGGSRRSLVAARTDSTTDGKRREATAGAGSALTNLTRHDR